MPTMHWLASEANSEEYLDVAVDSARVYAKYRDKYVPGGEMWVTESGDIIFGSFANSAASIGTPYSLLSANSFSASTGVHGSSALCSPGQFATETLSFAPIAFTKLRARRSSMWNPPRRESPQCTAI